MSQVSTTEWSDTHGGNLQIRIGIAKGDACFRSSLTK